MSRLPHFTAPHKLETADVARCPVCHQVLVAQMTCAGPAYLCDCVLPPWAQDEYSETEADRIEAELMYRRATECGWRAAA